MSFQKAAFGTALLAFSVVHSGLAEAQDKYMAEMFVTAATFCPRGTYSAAGQVLSIAQNSALFALLGTTYGGDGQTTFRLPDMRGRSAVGTGQGPGLQPLNLGEVTGSEQQTLLNSNLPMHVHTVTQAASTRPATHATPAPNRVLAAAQNAGIYVEGVAETQVSTGTTGVAGGSMPVNIRNPIVGVNWCIVAQGIFPPRD